MKYLKPLFCLCFLVVSIQVSAYEIAHQEVRLATSSGLYPYIFGAEDGCSSESGFCGFEVDLFKAICAEENLSCSWVKNPWPSIFDNLNNIDPDTLKYKYDAVVDSTDATPTRRLRMLFSAPYYSTKLLFVGSSHLSVDIDENGIPVDNKPLRIGTWKGFLTEELKRLYGEFEHFELVETTNPVEDLQAGRIDLAFLFTGLEVKLVKTGNFEVKGALIDTANKDPYGGVGAATRLSPSGRVLQQKFSNGLIKVRKNGLYRYFSMKWFGRDIWNCELGPKINDPLCVQENRVY